MSLASGASHCADARLRRSKRGLLASFAILWVASCLNPPYPAELVLQHIPTGLAICALVALDRRQPLTLKSYGAVLAFLSLHLLGARYLYSNVPYDEWARWVVGSHARLPMDWRRNHYDRLVHFAYGLLLVGVAREVLAGSLKLPRLWSHTLAIASIVATSAVYELLEWFVAISLAPDVAEAYNGQQGDMWDAQKDMALALAGALIATLTPLVRQQPKNDQGIGR